MADELKIPARVFDGLLALGELGPDKLSRLATAFSGERLTIDVQSRIRAWARELGVEEKVLGNAVAFALVPLDRERERRGLSTPDFLQALDQAVTNQAPKEWKDNNLKRWNSIRPQLPSLFRPDGFLSQASKAALLLYERPASTTDVRIFTEVRPLFDEQADSIKWLVLTNTLVITYQLDGWRHELHLNVDYDDLRNLAREAERAQKKSQRLVETAKQWEVGVLTFDNFRPADEND